MPLPALGQIPDTKSLSSYELIGNAKMALRYHNTEGAIGYLSAYAAQKPTDLPPIWQLAELLRQVGRMPDAADYYLSIHKQAPKQYPLALLRYAQALKSLARYDSAEVCLNNFLQKYKDKPDTAFHHYIARSELAGCKLRKDRSTALTNIQLLGKSINKKLSAKAATFVNDSTILFLQTNTNELPIVSPLDIHTIPNNRFYIAGKRGGSWAYKGPFFADQSTLKSNLGSGAFSADKQRFYFSACHQLKNGKIIHHIYERKVEANGWSAPVKLPSPINKKEYSSMQPTVGNCFMEGLEVLYFVSDREGGAGGYDIWYSIYNPATGKYNKPANAGSINSPGNEITPFYHLNSKTIYFSSDFWVNLGGFDVQAATGELVNWNAPKNIGSELNSEFHDLYYVLNDTQDQAFISSNRSGTCKCHNLYSITKANTPAIAVKGKVFTAKNGLIANYFDLDKKGIVKTEDNKPLSNAVVSLFLRMPQDKLTFIGTDTTDNRGYFNFWVAPDLDYRISISDERYLGKPIDFFAAQPTTAQDSLTVMPLTVEPIVDTIQYNVPNIYYAFNAWVLNDTAMQVLNNTVLQLLQDFPDLVAEISSHTDSVGSAKTNLKLSAKRAEHAVAYLIEQGIANDRIKAKGYGETRPIAPNSKPNGLDNPAGRAKNRRTEFKILGKLKAPKP